MVPAPKAIRASKNEVGESGDRLKLILSLKTGLTKS